MSYIHFCFHRTKLFARKCVCKKLRCEYFRENILLNRELNSARRAHYSKCRSTDTRMCGETLLKTSIFIVATATYIFEGKACPKPEPTKSTGSTTDSPVDVKPNITFPHRYVLIKGTLLSSILISLGGKGSASSRFYI